MIVFGADPGLAACGLALVEVHGRERRLVASDTVYTLPSMAHEARLDEIGRRALPMMRRADLVGLEEQGDAWHGKGARGQTNADARKVQDVLSLLRGLALALGRPREVLRPQTIRSLLGVGQKGGKVATARMVRILVAGVPAERRISQHAVDGIAHAVAAEKVRHVANTQGWIAGTKGTADAR